MKNIDTWFATSKIASFLRTFAAVVIAQAVTEFQRAGHFDFANWQTWVIAAAVSVVPPYLRYLNPQDTLS